MKSQASIFDDGLYEMQEYDRYREKRNKYEKEMWKICWDWDGPKVGEPCEVNDLLGIEYETGENSYEYMVPCIAVKELPYGIWIVKVNYGDDVDEWLKEQNGKLLVLESYEIWAPCDHLRKLRSKNNGQT